MALFVFDVDLTITAKHSHVTLRDSFQHPLTKEQQEDEKLVKVQRDILYSIPLLQTTEVTWKDVFETLFNQGHKVALATFSAYGYLLPRYLTDIVGLEPSLVDEINIRYATYDEVHSGAYPPKNKNGYIKELIECSSYKGSDVILVDDDIRNIAAARCHTIIATSEGTHLSQVLELLKHLEGTLEPKEKKSETEATALDAKPEPDSDESDENGIPELPMKNKGKPLVLSSLASLSLWAPKEIEDIQLSIIPIAQARKE